MVEIHHRRSWKIIVQQWIDLARSAVIAHGGQNQLKCCMLMALMPHSQSIHYQSEHPHQTVAQCVAQTLSKSLLEKSSLLAKSNDGWKDFYVWHEFILPMTKILK